MKRGLKENCTKPLIEDCVRHSHLPSCLLFFLLRNPQNVLLPWNPCSASPRTKSSEVAQFFYLLRKKALYSYLAVCTTHPLYPFIPCWLKYQLTRIVNPVFFAWKSNVTSFFSWHFSISVTWIIQLYFSKNSYKKNLPANDHFQFLSVITKYFHPVCTVNSFGFYMFFIFAHQST